MASATRLMMFLITVHTVLFFAGLAGVRPLQAGGNPHQQFLEEAGGDNITQSVRQSGESRIISDEFNVAFQSLNTIDVVSGIITAPYSIFANTALPVFLRTLGQILLIFLEAWVMAAFIRGVAA